MLDRDEDVLLYIRTRKGTRPCLGLLEKSVLEKGGFCLATINFDWISLI